MSKNEEKKSSMKSGKRLTIEEYEEQRRRQKKAPLTKDERNKRGIVTPNGLIVSIDDLKNKGLITDEVIGALNGGQDIYRDSSGHYVTNLKTGVELNKETGKITVYAPDYVIKRDGFKDHLTKALEPVSQMYRNNPSAMIPTMDGGQESIDSVIKKLNDPNNKESIPAYVDAVNMMRSQELGFTNADGDFVKGDRALYNIGDDMDLSDNYFAVRNAAALGEDVDDGSIQAISNLPEVRAVFSGLESYQEKDGVGYATYGDIMKNAWNRDVHSDKELIAANDALERYFALGDYKDEKELAANIATYEFINGDDPEASTGKDIVSHVGAFIEGLGDEIAGIGGYVTVGAASGVLAGIEQGIDAVDDILHKRAIDVGDSKIWNWYQDQIKYFESNKEERLDDRRLLLGDSGIATEKIGGGILRIGLAIAVGNALSSGAVSAVEKIGGKVANLAANEAGIGGLLGAVSSGAKTFIKLSKVPAIAKASNIMYGLTGHGIGGTLAGLAAETFGEALMAYPKIFYQVMNSEELTDEARAALRDEFIGNTVWTFVPVVGAKGIAKFAKTSVGRPIAYNATVTANKIAYFFGKNHEEFLKKIHKVDDIDVLIRQYRKAGKTRKADALAYDKVIRDVHKHIANLDYFKHLPREAGESVADFTKRKNAAIKEYELEVLKGKMVHNAIDEKLRDGRGILAEWYSSGKYTDFSASFDALRHSYDDLYRIESRILRVSSAARKSGKAGQLALTQESVDYINRRIRLDIVDNIIKNTADPSAAKLWVKEKETLMEAIAGFEAGAVGGSEEFRKAVGSFIGMYRKWAKNTNDMLINEGVLNKALILNKRASGNWGKDGELYAPLMHYDPEVELERPHVSVGNKKTTIDIEHYTPGATDHYMDPLVTANLYVSRFAEAKANQDLVKAYLDLDGVINNVQMSYEDTQLVAEVNDKVIDEAHSQMKKAITSSAKTIRTNDTAKNIFESTREKRKVFVSSREASKRQRKLNKVSSRPLEKYPSGRAAKTEALNSLTDYEIRKKWNQLAGKYVGGDMDTLPPSSLPVLADSSKDTTLEKGIFRPQTVTEYVTEHFKDIPLSLRDAISEKISQQLVDLADIKYSTYSVTGTTADYDALLRENSGYKDMKSLFTPEKYGAMPKTSRKAVLTRFLGEKTSEGFYHRNSDEILELVQEALADPKQTQKILKNLQKNSIQQSTEELFDPETFKRLTPRQQEKTLVSVFGKTKGDRIFQRSPEEIMSKLERKINEEDIAVRFNKIVKEKTGYGSAEELFSHDVFDNLRESKKQKILRDLFGEEKGNELYDSALELAKGSGRSDDLLFFDNKGYSLDEGAQELIPTDYEYRKNILEKMRKDARFYGEPEQVRKRLQRKKDLSEEEEEVLKKLNALDSKSEKDKKILAKIDELKSKNTEENKVSAEFEKLRAQYVEAKGRRIIDKYRKKYALTQEESKYLDDRGLSQFDELVKSSKKELDPFKDTPWMKENKGEYYDPNEPFGPAYEAKLMGRKTESPMPRSSRGKVTREDIAAAAAMSEYGEDRAADFRVYAIQNSWKEEVAAGGGFKEHLGDDLMKAAIEENPDLEMELMREIMSTSKFTGADAIKSFTRDYFKATEVTEYQDELLEATKELGEDAKKLNMSVKDLKSALNQDINVLIDSLCGMPEVAHSFDKMAEYYGVEAKPAREYYALKTLYEDRTIVRENLTKEIKAELLESYGRTPREELGKKLAKEVKDEKVDKLKAKKAEADISEDSAISSDTAERMASKFANTMINEITQRYEYMSAAMRRISPDLVNEKKLYADVRKLATDVSKNEADVHHIVATQDALGRIQLTETDPVLAGLVNQRHYPAPLKDWQKLAFLQSKIFRNGTTGIWIGSMVNQTTKDAVAAYAGAGVEHISWNRMMGEMEDFFGSNVASMFKGTDEETKEILSEIAKRHNITLATDQTIGSIDELYELSDKATKEAIKRLAKKEGLSQATAIRTFFAREQGVHQFVKTADAGTQEAVNSAMKNEGLSELDALQKATRSQAEAISPQMSEYETFNRGAEIHSQQQRDLYTGVNRVALNAFDRLDEGLNKAADFLGKPHNMRESFLRNRVYANAFTEAVKKGYSFQDARAFATFAMNNATTNFGRLTVHFADLSRTVPYLAAAINGSKSFMRLAVMDPVGVLGRVFGGIVIPTIAITAHSLASEENRKVWKSLKEYEKDDNIIFIVEGQKISIPIPPEISMLISPIRHAVETMYDVNNHSFWELATNDAIGISPIDLSGFLNIDANMMADGMGDDRGYFIEHMASGLTRLSSQLMPPAGRTAVSMITGYDPYTLKKINKDMTALDHDTWEEMVADDRYTTVAIAMAKFFQGTPFEMSPAMAEQVLSNTIGKAPIHYAEWLAKLSAVVTSDDASKSMDSALSLISEDITNPIIGQPYASRQQRDWKDAVRMLYAQRDQIMVSPQWRKYLETKRNARTPDQIIQANAMRDNLTENYYNNIKSVVDSLTSEYGGTLTPEKYASVLSLSILSGIEGDYTVYGEKAIGKDAYNDALKKAHQTLYKLGFSSPHDYSAFGKMEMSASGEPYLKVMTPLAILDLEDRRRYSGKLHLSNAVSILEARGLDKNSSALREARAKRSAIYDKGFENMTEEDWDEIDHIALEWDMQVLEALHPYIELYGVDNFLKDDETLDYLDGIFIVPNQFMIDGRGRRIARNKYLNKSRGFARGFIEYIYTKTEGLL